MTDLMEIESQQQDILRELKRKEMSNKELIRAQGVQKEIEQNNIKSVLCNNRCSFVFQPLSTTQIQVNDKEITEKITQGCFFCTTCGYTIDFEHE